MISNLCGLSSSSLSLSMLIGQGSDTSAFCIVFGTSAQINFLSYPVPHNNLIVIICLPLSFVFSVVAFSNVCLSKTCLQNLVFFSVSLQCFAASLEEGRLIPLPDMKGKR